MPKSPPCSPKVETVVGGEDDRGLFHQAHVLDGLQQVTQPRVHHRDLSAVGGMAFPELLFVKSRHIMPVSVQREHHLAVVFRPVELGVVGRRVPRFMGVPGVYVEEEVVLIVMLQPLHGSHEGARRVPVRFVAPCRPYVLGLMMVAGPGNHGPQGILPPIHEKGLEPPVIVHSVPEVVGGVD